MPELVDVTAVEVIGPHRLRVRFADRAEGEIDFAGRSWQGIFEPLQDPAYFAQVSVDAELGTIVWPNGADFAPETLYELAVNRRRTA
ncbi:MAG: DUF2442 domain-containing protein [Actinomycetota bacterium]